MSDLHLKSVFRSKLLRKILLMMMAVGIVPIVIAGVLSLYSVTLSHEASISGVEQSLLNQKSGEAKSIINDIVGNTFQIITQYDQTADISISDQESLLRGFLSAESALREISFISLGNQELTVDKRTESGEETARYVRSSSGDPQKLQDLRNRSQLDEFKFARAGKAYLSPVYFTLTGPMMTIASPVRNKNGVVISVISGEVSLKKVQDSIASASLGNTGYVYLVNQDGLLIGKSDSQLTTASFSALPLVADALRQKYISPSVPIRFTNIFGKQVVAVALSLPELHWAIVAEWPTQEADAILVTLRNEIFLFSFIGFLFTLILSIFLASQIVRPIKALEEGTQYVATGKFDRTVDIRTGDEIEELGTAFNKMEEGLKELQQLKDEFVFIAAHELKTPVAAIKGYLTLVLQGIAGPVNDKTKEFLEKVMGANARLIRLVDDLLEVARSEAGKLKIEVAAIEIAPAIQSTISELKSLADEKKITLVYNPSPALPKVMADSDRVKEVMVNLVGNAIKYTIGSGTVTIAHEVQKDVLITTIQDTGIGMSKEDQQKLFTKFYRVATEKTRDISGTGLGLFIVKEIISKMNGEISVTSEEGKGSVFQFSLPLVRV